MPEIVLTAEIETISQTRQTSLSAADSEEQAIILPCENNRYCRFAKPGCSAKKLLTCQIPKYIDKQEKKDLLRQKKLQSRLQSIKNKKPRKRILVRV
jgi:hypothetical protein